MFIRRSTRRLRRLRRQRGMTLLEIMIVLAILGLVMAFLIGPRVMRMFQESKEDLARMQVRQLASEAYPQWNVHSGKKCPSDIGELLPYVNNQSKTDNWGVELQMICGDNLPPAAQKAQIGIVSAGPNGKMGDEDDIKSWE
jgi:prepilin-type N-terminal cleavage/methylation domain-containing protein